MEAIGHEDDFVRPCDEVEGLVWNEYTHKSAHCTSGTSASTTFIALIRNETARWLHESTMWQNDI